MSTLVLKVKSKSGQNIIKALTAQSTIKELKNELCNLTNVPASKMRVLYGFPPKILDLIADDKFLESTGLTTGDTLIVEELQSAVVDELEPKAFGIKDGTNTSTGNAQPESRVNLLGTSPSNGSGILLKKVVAADNSCLFSSIHFVLNGKDDETGTVIPWLRQLISETVSKDPDTYSEAILGKSNSDYCAWIQDEKSWGGAIELSILSNYYGIEIAVVDTINAIINRFGEDKSYPLRVFLLFDGIHYDPLYREPFDGGKIQTIFPVEDQDVFKDAEQLAIEAQSSRQFTDVNKFRLKCLVCSVILDGQVAAQQHAKSTGHSNFGEI